MKREITNAARYFMDNWLPPVIRDNKYFMYPVFYYWFNGQNIGKIMNFKKDVFYMSEEEYAHLYKTIVTRAKERPTDMNNASIEHVINNADKNAETLLDVGSGRGYFLNVLAERTRYKLTGTDMADNIPGLKANYVKGVIEKLPFPDKSFDIVTCTHTIEHIINLKQAIDELKRVARKQVIIVTPCQKYNFYTLDLHVNFFPTREMLNREIGMTDYECVNMQGDWVYIGNVGR
jgi:SAM-dependent methyltransferase